MKLLRILIVVHLAMSCAACAEGKTAVKKAPSKKIPAAVADIQMIHISAGKFLMGNSGKEGFFKPEELPQHPVTLATYSIGKYEVTRGQYKQFMNAGGYTNRIYWSDEGWSWKESKSRAEPRCWTNSQWQSSDQTFTQTDKHPVIGVTYYEAEAFCKWAGGHLPTEAQWEKAARWNKTHPNVYPWGDVWDVEKCNNSNDHNPAGGGYQAYQTAPVGSYPNGASPYGCQDMAGNVQEWCQDWLVSYPGRSSIDYTDQYRVLRGGRWGHSDCYVLRCASRDGCNPSDESISIGFRLAR